MCVYVHSNLFISNQEASQAKNNQTADQDQQQIQNFWKKKSKVIFNSFKSYCKMIFYWPKKEDVIRNLRFNHNWLNAVSWVKMRVKSEFSSE